MLPFMWLGVVLLLASACHVLEVSCALERPNQKVVAGPHGALQQLARAEVAHLHSEVAGRGDASGTQRPAAVHTAVGGNVGQSKNVTLHPSRASGTKNVTVHPKAIKPAAGAAGFLLRAAGECKCKFKDVCSCHSAMEFMNCVSDACASGTCKCADVQFLHACTTIAKTCGELDISCSNERALCMFEEEVAAPQQPDRAEKEETEVKVAIGGDRDKNITAKDVEDRTRRQRRKKSSDTIYEELRDLKEQRCRLELAKDDGWFNAGRRLLEVQSSIGERMEELNKRGERLPEMHCEKHFEEWHDPSTTTSKLAMPLLDEGAVEVKSEDKESWTWRDAAPVVFAVALLIGVVLAAMLR